MYRYKAYDLIIDSEIEFPELFQTEGEPDITLKFGDIPSNKQDVKLRLGVDDFGVRLYEDKSCFVKLKGIGSYFISTNYNVTLERDNKANENEVRAYFLTMILPAILYFNETIALHGSTIAFGDHCILFTGKSGVGKSTMAGKLLNNGGLLLSDDICVVKSLNNIPHIIPAAPQLKLNPDSALFIKRNPSELQQITEKHEKGWVNVEKDFQFEPLPLRTIYEIIPTDKVVNVEFIELKGKDKLQAIMTNTYKPEIIEYLDLQKKLFKQSVWLSSMVKFHRIKRPLTGYFDESSINVIVKDFEIRK